MKSLALLALIATVSVPAIAAPVKLDRNTRKIIPTEQIHKFAPINWEKVAKRADAGKPSGDNTVMQCDDHFASLVEIKIEEGLEGVSIDSDCELHGASHFQDNDAFLQFQGGDCEIKIQKERANKAPLLVTYEISDAC